VADCRTPVSGFQRGPDDGGEDRDEEHNEGGEVVVGLVGGAAVVDARGGALQVEEMDGEPAAGEAIGAGEQELEADADDGDDAPEGGVAAADEVLGEVAEEQAEGEAGERGPVRGLLGDGLGCWWHALRLIFGCEGLEVNRGKGIRFELTRGLPR